MLRCRGLPGGGDVNDVVADLAPLHPKRNTFPGELFLELGADMLELAGVSTRRRCTMKACLTGSCRSARSGGHRG